MLVEKKISLTNDDLSITTAFEDEEMALRREKFLQVTAIRERA
jgi:hypothetical protein